jgi:hypothetical protein
MTDVADNSIPTDDTKICPDCAETIKAAARKCRFCGLVFDGSQAIETEQKPPMADPIPPEKLVYLEMNTPGGEIKVTGAIARINSTDYPIRNISSVETGKIDPPIFWTAITGIIAGIFGFLGFLVLTSNSPQDRSASVIFFLPCAIFAIWSFILQSGRLEREGYVLLISTSGQQHKTLFNKKPNDLQIIQSAINKAIGDLGRPIFEMPNAARNNSRPIPPGPAAYPDAPASSAPRHLSGDPAAWS